jgi:hypothetical protein
VVWPPVLWCPLLLLHAAQVLQPLQREQQLLPLPLAPLLCEQGHEPSQVCRPALLLLLLLLLLLHTGRQRFCLCLWCVPLQARHMLLLLQELVDAGRVLKLQRLQGASSILQLLLPLAQLHLCSLGLWRTAQAAAER